VTPPYDPDADDLSPPAAPWYGPDPRDSVPDDATRPNPRVGDTTWEDALWRDAMGEDPVPGQAMWHDPASDPGPNLESSWQPPPPGERSRRRQARQEAAAPPPRARPVSLDDVGDDFVEIAPKRRGLPKVMLAMVVVLVLLVASAVVVRTWYRNQIDPPGSPGAFVEVEVPRGATVNDLGNQLADKHVISNATLFHVWVRKKHLSVEAGSYRFRAKSSFDEAAATVRKGPIPPRVTAVTIPEGLTLTAMEAKLAKAVPRFDAKAIHAALTSGEVESSLAGKDPTNLEGLLYPSTYQLGEEDDALALVRRMAKQMEVVVGQNGGESGVQGANVPKLTPYQVLVVASLVQAEAGSAAEAPKIARVIYNRVQAQQPLGVDATSRYQAQREGKPIDFESSSPYNTRRRPGLPPTPIDAPSDYAIKAALHPATGPWLYYVLARPRQHAFTTDYNEFLRLKQACEQKGLGCG
jgi:UPF0755 protein